MTEKETSLDLTENRRTIKVGQDGHAIDCHWLRRSDIDSDRRSVGQNDWIFFPWRIRRLHGSNAVTGHLTNLIAALFFRFLFHSNPFRWLNWLCPFCTMEPITHNRLDFGHKSKSPSIPYFGGSRNSCGMIVDARRVVFFSWLGALRNGRASRAIHWRQCLRCIISQSQRSIARPAIHGSRTPFRGSWRAIVNLSLSHAWLSFAWNCSCCMVWGVLRWYSFFFLLGLSSNYA